MEFKATSLPVRTVQSTVPVASRTAPPVPALPPRAAVPPSAAVAQPSLWHHSSEHLLAVASTAGAVSLPVAAPRVAMAAASKRRPEHSKVWPRTQGGKALAQARLGRAEEGRVVRTYRSATLLFGNVNGSISDGLGLSFSGGYDSSNDTINPRIHAGGPANGTDIGMDFSADFKNEFAWFSKVFRYGRVKKMQMRIIRAPATVMQLATMAGDPPSIQQVGNPGNLLDPGVIIMRPWSGRSNEADFTNGALVGTDWDDQARYKEKVMASASSKSGETGELVLAVDPVSTLFEFAEGEQQPSGGGFVKFVRSPVVDFSDFRTGVTNFSAYGWIWYWYYPMNAGAITNQIKLGFDFEIEFEYFGLVQAALPPTISSAAEQALKAEGKDYGDSERALVAEAQGVRDPGLVRRPRPPPVLPVAELHEQLALSTGEEPVLVSSPPTPSQQRPLATKK